MDLRNKALYHINYQLKGCGGKNTGVKDLECECFMVIVMTGKAESALTCKRKRFDYLWLRHLICISVTALAALTSRHIYVFTRSILEITVARMELSQQYWTKPCV